VSVSVSGIAAALPQVAGETAPAALLGNIEKIVHGLTGVADPAKPVTAVFYPGSESPRQDTPANPAP
jgi:hypothetical protein